MNAMEAYFANVKNVLERVWDSQREAMETAAQWMSRRNSGFSSQRARMLSNPSERASDSAFRRRTYSPSGT